MEWTRGLVAILLCLAVYLSSVHSLGNLNLKVTNLGFGQIESWGFNVFWDGPVAPQNQPLPQVDEYILELWSGDVKIETQTFAASDPRLHTFDGLPPGTNYTVVVWSVQFYGANNDQRTISYPERSSVKTLAGGVTLETVTEEILRINIPATGGNFAQFGVEFEDVKTGQIRSTTRTNNNVAIQVVQSDLHTISGDTQPQRGRLIEVRVREEAGGPLLYERVRFRTLLDSVSIQEFNNPTGTSVDVRANYVSEADQLEVVATCVSGGCPVVTAPIQSGIDSPVTDLIGGETYSFVVRAAVGEQDRPDPFRPLYTFAEGNPSQWTLVSLSLSTIGNPNQLDIAWTPINQPSLRLRVIVENGNDIYADADPLSDTANTARISGLQPATLYTVQLTYNGGIPLSTEDFYTPLQGLSGKPSKESCTQTSLTMTWNPVIQNNNIAFKYELSISPSPDPAWVPINNRYTTTETEYTFLGLTANRDYVVSVRTVIDDPTTPDQVLIASIEEVSVFVKPAMVDLSVAPVGTDALVYWSSSIPASSQYKVILETYFDADNSLDAEITPGTDQVYASDDQSHLYEGLQPGVVYQVTLWEQRTNGDLILLSEMEFKLLITIAASLNELNAKKAVINFKPANSVAYDGYLIEASGDLLDDICAEYILGFGQQWLDEWGCGRYWVSKPGGCSISYDITATRLDRRVSNALVLSATNDEPIDYTLYEAGSSETSIKVWWRIGNANFDYYYLEVKEITDSETDIDPVVYCTAIPRPSEPWTEVEIEGLDPATCYQVTLKQWLYTESRTGSFDVSINVFTTLGNEGAVSALYVLTQTDNNLELGWGKPNSLTESQYTGYQVCLEPVENPASNQRLTLSDTDIQLVNLDNAVDRTRNRQYRVAVNTYLSGTGKHTKYSDLTSDDIDLDAPFRGALTVTDRGSTFLVAEWHRDEAYLPTTDSYRVSVYTISDVDGSDVLIPGYPVTLTGISSTPINRDITSLLAGTLYCIRVDWLNTVPPISRRVCERTLPERPGPIEVLDVGLTDIRIRWNQSPGNKDFYLIYVTDLDNQGQRMRSGRTEEDVTEFILDGLIPDTNYRIEVEAVSGTESENTPSQAREEEQKTNAIDPCKIIITSLSTGSIEVRWGICPNAKQLEICPPADPSNPGSDPFPSILDISDFDTADERLYTFNGLRESKKYSIFLRGETSLEDSTATYTEALNPVLSVDSQTPTSLTVTASAVMYYPDSLHTIIYSLFDGDSDELLQSVTTNGRNNWVWTDLEPGTSYFCRAEITAGLEADLQPRRNEMSGGIVCSTTGFQTNQIYLKSCSDTTLVLIWGNLDGIGPYQIEITSPSQDGFNTLRFAVLDDSEREVGDLEPGQYYIVELVRGSITESVLEVFTKPSSHEYEVDHFNQTTISIIWDWPGPFEDELIDFFAIDYQPEVTGRNLPVHVPFWHRAFTLQCLLPGRPVDISLTSVIKDGGYYYNSLPFTTRSLQVEPAELPRTDFQMICVCVGTETFTIAWSDWTPSTGFIFEGYIIEVYPYSFARGFQLMETVKVAPEDTELFHTFYAGLNFNEYVATPYPITALQFFLIHVRIAGTDTINLNNGDLSDRKLILTKPNSPVNLRRVSLDAPESKTSLKVAWDEGPQTAVDCKTTYIVYYNRFGSDDVKSDKVYPDNGDPLEYTLTGLDPQDPNATPDLADPEQRPAAYSVWVVCVCEATFGGNGRKKRQATDNVPEESFEVVSEPSVLPYDQGLTAAIDPAEILVQDVGTRTISALFGADPDNAHPDGKYRFFIAKSDGQDVLNLFEPRGGRLDVEDAPYFFDYLFDDLLPGTVFTITLAVETKLPPAGMDSRTSIEVLTCPEPPNLLDVSEMDEVSLEYTWVPPYGQHTSFEVTFERPDEAPEVQLIDDLSISFDTLYPNTEYTITIRTMVYWEDGDETKYSEPITLTTRTEEVSLLEIVVQEFGTDFINIVFGSTPEDVVYEVSIDPGNCPCGWIEQGMYCYYVAHTYRETYQDAENLCQEYGSELTSVLDLEEQEFISGCAENDPDSAVPFGFWIGLNDRNSDGSFQWTDQSTYNSANAFWADSQPDNSDIDNDCTIVMRDGGTQNTWSVIDCDLVQPFICKKLKARPDVDYPVQPASDKGYLFTDLIPGQCFTITLDADEYTPRNSIQRTRPEQVSGLSAPATTTSSAKIMWTAPPGVHDGYFISYVQSDNGEDPTDYPYELLPGSTYVELKDLLPDTDYTVTIQTIASYGDCPEYWSDPVTFEFTTDPCSPGSVYVKDVSTDSIAIKWCPPSNTFQLDGYQLSLCPDSCDSPVIFRDLAKSKYIFEDLVPGREYAIIYQVLRSDNNHDQEILLLQRTLPSRVPAGSFLAELTNLETVELSWAAPLEGGDFDQYALTYSILDRYCPKEIELVTKYFTKDIREYELWVKPSSVVFASIRTRSQVSCTGEPTYSAPEIIYGTNSATLRPLEIHIYERTTTSLLVAWGRIVDPDVENVLYTLTWYSELDQLDVTTRVTKNNKWLIQGLLAGMQYYIKVEYGNLESSNRGYYSTAIYPPNTLTAIERTSNSAKITWPRDSTNLVNEYRITYGSNCDDKKVEMEIITLDADDIEDNEDPYVLLDGLQPNTEYKFKVLAIHDDSDIHATSSAMSQFQTEPIAFNECEIIEVEPTSVTAIWDAISPPVPAQSNGEDLDVFMYKRQIRVADTLEVQGEEKFLPSDNPYVEFDNLWPGRQYELCCKVIQINSDRSTPLESCQLQVTAPEVPASLELGDETHRGFCAEWAGPSTNFDNYVIMVLNEAGDIVYPLPPDATLPADNPVYESLPRDTTARCIDGLFPGSTYTFVVGTWVDGEPVPQFSETIMEDVTTVALDALEILLEEQTKDSLTIEWGGIQDDTIENPEYIVKWYKDGEPENEQASDPTNTLRWTIPNLEAGTGYYITVCNGDDESPNSDVFYTVPCPPEAPIVAAPTDTNSGTRFTIAWSPPSDGGFERFRISYYRDDESPEDLTIADTVDADVRVYTLGGLYVNTLYNIFVETLVGVDDEERQTASENYVIMGQTLPLDPLILELSSKDTNSILIGWGPIVNPTNQETRYTITAETQTGLGTGSVAAIDTVAVGDVTISELGPLNSGIKYNIQVTIGDQESEVLCVYSLPEQPGDISLNQATAETLRISWSPALNFVGEYEITYVPESGDPQPVRKSPQDRMLYLEGLERNTDYEFTIVNTVGEGDLKTDSEPQQATFRTRNAKLTIVGDPTTTEITAQWTPEAGDVDSYILRVIDTEQEDQRTIEAPESQLTEINNLVPGTPYRLELYSVFDGVEILSDIETANTLPAPPVNIVLSGTFSAINVDWEEPSVGKYDEFEVTYDYTTPDPDESRGRTSSPSNTIDTNIDLEGLLPEKEFQVEVKSVRRFGEETVLSEAISGVFTTLVAPDGSLIVRSVTDDSIGVRWTSVEGAEDGYNLQVKNINNINDIKTYPDPFTTNEYLIEDLLSGAVYEITLKAILVSGGDNQFQATIPQMVSSLSRIQRSIDSITLGWDGFSGGSDTKGEATGFVVTVYPLPDDAPPFWEVPNRPVPGEEVTFSLENLINDQNYDFTIVTYTEFTGKDNVVRRETSEAFKYSVRTYDLNPGQVQVLNKFRDSVCFKWGSTESGAATGYVLRIEAVNNASDYQEVTRQINTPILEHCFDDVEPGTLYDVTVDVIGSQESGAERVRTDASPPENLEEEISFQCSISISWDPAEGQADAYRVYYRLYESDDELELLDTIYSSEDLEYTLEDLIPETKYEFHVVTVTARELEEVSDAAVIVLETDIELLTVEQNGNTLMLSWDPVEPSFLVYEVHYYPDDGDLPNSIFVAPSAAALSQVFTGLTTGQQYTVLLNTVSVLGIRNFVGRTCFTLVPPPIPGNSLTVRPLAGQPHNVIVSFGLPDINTVIDSWHVRATPGGTGAGVGDPVEVEFIVPFEACPEVRLYGLCPETYYIIAVITQAGTSLSEPVTTSITTPSASPGQISFGEYTSTSLEVFWYYAGAPITPFTVRISYETADGITQVREQREFQPGGPRTYIFRDLTPGVLYTVTVSVTGVSSFLDRKSIRTRPILLLGNFVATQVDHDSVTLNWPTATGVDGYEVCYFDVNDQVSISYDVDDLYTVSTIDNLNSDTNYVFSVASYIGEEADRSTSEKLTVTATTAEDPTVAPPANLYVHSVGPHEATLQWDQPIRDNYDYFLVEYSPNDVGDPASPVLLPRDQYSIEISNLVSDTTYLFAVYAVQGRVGLGEVRSIPVSVIETTDSFPFTIETLEVTDTRIGITWGQPQTTSLFNYEVTFEPSDGIVTRPIVSTNDLRVASLQNLQPDRYYDITVWARDFSGDILDYTQRTVKTLDLPVRSLRAGSETPNSVFLIWPPATEQSFGGAQTVDDTVVAYQVVLRGYSDYRGPGAFIDTESAGQSACPSLTLRDLEPGHKYYVSVIAVDENGEDVTAPASIVIQTLPAEVLDLHVIDVTSNSIEVAWSEATGGFSNYLLQYSPPGSTSIATIFSKDDEREFEIEGLQAGQLYSIQLIVQSITDYELYSTTIYQHTVPVSPSNLIFNGIRDTGFNTAWPAVNSFSDYYGFCVFPDPQDINVEEVYGTSFELEDLAPNTNYLVSVFNTVSQQGDETWSVPISEYQQTTVGQPGVPIVIDYDETSVDVNWVRVDSVNRYYVRRTKVDGTDLFTETVQATDGLTVDYTFGGLQPGYEYLLSVRPDSAQYQEESTQQRTRPLPPLFPRSETNLESPGERTITWQPPVGKVDRYELIYSPPNGSPPPPIYVNAGEPLRRTIYGLDPRQTYVFIVTSEAGVYGGEILTRSEPAIADIDLVVQLSVENFDSYFINVAWPTLPGNFDTYVISYDPFDEYKPNVRPSPVEIGRQYDVTSLNIYGLEPGQEYTISLQTKTGLSYSPVIQQVIQTTVPLNVEDILVDLITASSFTFSWDAAEGYNDRYQVFFDPVADVNNPAPALGNLPRETLYDATGGRRTIEVSDLEPAQEYRITVVTWSNDQSSTGTTVIATTRPFPPGFIEVLGTTSNSVEVQWFINEDHGNRGVTKYQVEVAPRGNTRPIIIDANSGRNSQVIPGLIPGQAYQARIQSIVVDVNGEYLESLPVSAAFVTIPLSPIFTSNPDVTASAITLRWQSGGGQLTRYQVEYYPEPDNPSIVSPINVGPSPNLELTISGLDPSTEYTFSIIAITSVTVSDSQSGVFDVIKESLSNTVFYTTLPFGVPNFYVTSTTSTSIGLAWSEPPGPSDSYRLEIRSDAANSRTIDINPFEDLEYLVQGLQPDTDYRFSIANIANGRSSVESHTTASTNEGIPGPPAYIDAEQTSPNSIRVEWYEPEETNGDIDGYVLVISKRSTDGRSQIESEDIVIEDPTVLFYEFDDLPTGYQYSFTIAALNSAGVGEPYQLGEFIPIRETSPPETDSTPYETTKSDDPYTISISWRRSFFDYVFGPVANYSVLVVEDRHDLSTLDVSVGNPPRTYAMIKQFTVWPAYQASPRGYNPFITGRVKRQTLEEAEFIIGEERDCPDNPYVYCNGRLRPSTDYRVAIRAYGQDGTFTDTPWSDPISTAYDVWYIIWFVIYGVAGLIGLIIILLIMCCCVRLCCGRRHPGDKGMFEDSEDSQTIMMMKSMNHGTPPMEYKRPHHRPPPRDYRPPPPRDYKPPLPRDYRPPQPRIPRSQPPSYKHQAPPTMEYEKDYRPPMYREPSSKPRRESNQSRRVSHQSRRESQQSRRDSQSPRRQSDIQPKERVYAPPTSNLSKPIFIDQFNEHMRLMNMNGGVRFTEEHNRLSDIGANMQTNAAEMSSDKNRYRNILPYDNNRVCLQDSADGSDYVNASFVDGVHGKNEYIVTQGPLPNTIEDFWEMVSEHEIPTIIMNTNLVEAGRVKCEKYWPDSGEAQYGRMTVKLISESDTSDWTVRTFDLCKDGVFRGNVRLYHFRNWPDNGAPSNPRSVLKFLRMVRTQHPRKTGPGVLVHCSAGVGRSGTFVAVDMLLQQIMGSDRDTVDILGLIAKLRQQRRHMVQSEAQYKFIHSAVQMAVQQQASMDSLLDGGSNWGARSVASTGGFDEDL